jgi:hypothetical protein
MIDPSFTYALVGAGGCLAGIVIQGERVTRAREKAAWAEGVIRGERNVAERRCQEYTIDLQITQSWPLSKGFTFNVKERTVEDGKPGMWSIYSTVSVSKKIAGAAELFQYVEKLLPSGARIIDAAHTLR